MYVYVFPGSVDLSVCLYWLETPPWLVGLNHYTRRQFMFPHPLPPQPETRGSVNGISQSLVAVGRSVGPVLGSVLFAWSASSGKSQRATCMCVHIHVHMYARFVKWCTVEPL